MKPVIEKHGETLVSQQLTPVPMGISENVEDQLMIMNVLTNTLYSDKVSACLREYGCNGYDANLEAGKADKPIDVTLPNKLEPTLVIRDYGASLTQEQVLSIFCKLGRSTKRESNAFTGMLGIGSKAGFAYGDSFMVISYVGGKKTIYNAYRDKGVPRIALFEVQDSAEPDGLEIRVPVRVQDIEEFVKKAERVYRYFKVRPAIHGASVTFDVNPPQITGPNWRYVGDGKSVAIMGNVGYDLTAASMGTVDLKYSTLIGLGVELDFDIGDLEIAANREGLQYKDHTKGKIIERLTQVSAEIGKSFSDRVAKATSLWEAKTLYADSFEKMGSNQYGMRTLKEVVQGVVMWKGEKINSSNFNVHDLLPRTGPQVNIWQISQDSRHGRLRRAQNPWEVRAGAKTTLAINDLASGHSSPARERGFFQANPDANALIIFTFPDDKTRALFWKASKLEGAPTIKLSTIAPAATVASGGSGPSMHRAKHSSKVFVLGENAIATAAANSQWWKTETADLKKDKGVYVQIFEFQARYPGIGPLLSYEAPWILLPKIVNIRKAGLLTTPLFGFKHDRIDKLGKGWVRLETHLKTQMEALVKKKGLAQDMADYLIAAAYAHIFDSKHAGLMPKGSFARTWLEEQHRMLNPKNSIELLMYLHTNQGQPWLVRPVLPKPSSDLAALDAQARAVYPMLAVWDTAKSLYRRGVRCQDSANSEMQTFAEYVKLVGK